MEKNKDRTLGFFLIFRSIFIIIFCLSLSAQDSTGVLKQSDSTVVEYPGKPLLMSLLVPGLGQLSNKEPLWKPSLFFGIEVFSVAGFVYANKKAEAIARINASSDKRSFTHKKVPYTSTIINAQPK